MKVSVIEKIISEIENRSIFPLIARFKADCTIALFNSPDEGVHLFIGTNTLPYLKSCYCEIGEHRTDMTNINSKNVIGGYLWEILDNSTLKFEK